MAGATVRAKTPFEELTTFKTDFELTKEFIDKYVRNFYSVSVINNAFIKSYQSVKEDIDEDIVEKLLGDFNWRTRMPGSIFAAIKNYDQYIDII